MTARRLTRTALRQELRRLSRRFAEELFETLDEFGVWEELARRERARRAPAGSKRVRRSEDALRTVSKAVATALRAEKQPVAISAIARRMGTTPRQIAHPLALLVASGTVRKTGERRGARYALVSTRARRAPPRGRGPASRTKRRASQRKRRG